MTAILISDEDRATAKQIVEACKNGNFSASDEAWAWLERQITIAIASAVTAAIAETIKPILPPDGEPAK